MDEISREDTAIKPVLFKEVKKEIQSLNTRKAPGFDHITAELLQQLPDKGIMKITHHINAVFRLKCVPDYWKKAEVITIIKPGKPPTEPSSY